MPGPRDFQRKRVYDGREAFPVEKFPPDLNHVECEQLLHACTATRAIRGMRSEGGAPILKTRGRRRAGYSRRSTHLAASIIGRPGSRHSRPTFVDHNRVPGHVKSSCRYH